MNPFRVGDSVVVKSFKMIKKREGINPEGKTRYGQIGQILTIREITPDVCFFQEVDYGHYFQDLKYSVIHDSPLMRTLRETT